MLTKLLQAIYVPKRARQKLAARNGRPPAAAKSRSAPVSRDKLLDETMALYRRQRQDVYETLDEATRRQIEDDAEKAFGKALRPKG